MASFKLNEETSLALPPQATFSLLKISTVITVAWLNAMLSSNSSLNRDAAV